MNISLHNKTVKHFYRHVIHYIFLCFSFYYLYYLNYVQYLNLNKAKSQTEHLCHLAYHILRPLQFFLYILLYLILCTIAFYFNHTLHTYIHCLIKTQQSIRTVRFFFSETSCNLLYLLFHLFIYKSTFSYVPYFCRIHSPNFKSLHWSLKSPCVRHIIDNLLIIYYNIFYRFASLTQDVFNLV